MPQDFISKYGSVMLKRLVNLAGFMGSFIAVVFVLHRLNSYRTALDFSQFGFQTLLILVCAIVVYSAANALLTLVWWNLLQDLGDSSSFGSAFHIYGLSQLAKYIPGNIFHLASRQTLGMAAGIKGWILGKSIVYELLVICASALVFSIAAVSLLIPWVSGTSALMLSLGMLSLAVWAAKI